MTSDPKWLEWARELQTIAQAGLTYAKDAFDIERYEAIRLMSAEIVAAQSNTDLNRVHDLFAGEYGHPTPKVDVSSRPAALYLAMIENPPEDGCPATTIFPVVSIATDSIVSLAVVAAVITLPSGIKSPVKSVPKVASSEPLEFNRARAKSRSAVATICAEPPTTILPLL